MVRALLLLAAVLVLPGCITALIATRASSGYEQPTGPADGHLGLGGGYANGEGDATGGFGEARLLLTNPKHFGAFVDGELGRFGGRTFGSIDLEGGPMFGGGGFVLGASTGIAYGGYGRNALTIPARLIVSVKPGAVGATAMFHGGYRLGDSDADLDASASWGARLELHLGPRLALTPGVAWDREDHADVFTVRVAGTLHVQSR